jgi:hypothetical protein
MILPSFSAKKDDPILLKATLFTHTNDDDKDHDTCIFVDVISSDGSSLIAHAANGDCSSSDGTQYKDDSEHQFDLQCDAVGMKKDGCKKFKVNIHQETHGGAGHDTWKFNAKLVLHFSDNSTIIAKKDGIVLVNNNASDSFLAQ